MSIAFKILGRPRTVYVVSVESPTDIFTQAAYTEEGAYQKLYEYVVERWNVDMDGVFPKETQYDTIHAFFRRRSDREWWAIQECKL